jgi:BA14K-like protein
MSDTGIPGRTAARVPYETLAGPPSEWRPLHRSTLEAKDDHWRCQMTSKSALKATAIGALVLIATAAQAQAQRLQGGNHYDPAYATNFGFAPEYGSGPYAYDNRSGNNSNSAYGAAEDVSSPVQRHRAYGPATGTYLGYDGRRHSSR